MHQPYWLHRSYTVYMAILYTKQGAVKLSKMLMKSMLRPHLLPHRIRIDRQTAQTSNMVRDNVPSRLQRRKWATIIHTMNTWCMLHIKAGAASMAGAWFIYWPEWPCGRCIVYMDHNILIMPLLETSIFPA